MVGTTDVRSRLAGAVAALRGGGRGWTLLAVAGGWLFILGMRFLIPALLPQIKAAFDVDNAAAGLAVTVIWATYAAMQLPSGMLVDRVGERGLLAASLAFTAASLVALSAAPIFVAFLLGCAAFGLGTGLFGPPRGTVLSRTYPDNDGAAFGATLAAGSVGAAALPLAAGLVVGALGWRATVGAAVPAFALLAAGAWWAVPSRPADGVPTPSLRRAADGTARALTDRSVVVGLAAVTLLLFAFQGVTAFLPTYLVEVKGLSPSVAAGLYALLFLSGAVFQLIAGGAADRYGDRPVLGAVAAFSVLPLVALPLVAGLAVLAVLVAGVGVRMAIGPVNNAYLVDALPREVQGTAWGLLRTLFFAVGSTGSTVVGALADAGYFDASFWLLAALTAVGASLYYFLPARS